MGKFFGARVRSRRKELRLSQKELADGICKQGQISRLENGEYTPGSALLHQLAKRLNVSMDYFFDEQMSSEITELFEFKKIAKTFMSQRNYESLAYIYELEKAKAHRLSRSDKIYLEWVASLVDFYCHGREEEAIEKLEKLVQSLDKSDINFLHLLNSLFNLYYETENLTRFDKMKEELRAQLHQLHFNTIEELELSIKINFNLSRYYWLQNNIELAIKQVTSTIKLCQEYRTTYLLADLYVILGNISENFSAQSEVKSYFETAYFLYKNIDENKEMALTIEHYIADNF